MDVQGGSQAAASVVKLMREVAQTLSPQTIIDAYVDSNHAIGPMWETLRDATTTVLADGCLDVCGSHPFGKTPGSKVTETQIPAQQLRAIEFNSLKQLYEDANFAPSLYLPGIDTDTRFDPVKIL